MNVNSAARLVSVLCRYFLMLNEVKNYSGLNNNKKMCEWLCDSERERFCVCVCVRESFRIHSSIFNVSCCTSVAMYQNAVTWHALLYIKKRKEKKEQAASCPVFLYKCWLILEGGRESVSCHSVFYSFYRNTPSQESQASSFSLSKSDPFANVPKRMSVFLYKCKGSATVRTYDYCDHYMLPK